METGQLGGEKAVLRLGGGGGAEGGDDCGDEF